ncbi:MAG TPA: hypothetical protein VM100_04625 [Longimicrobiales bacterium]|nr:hypothetical protein [Longimicrobiales bacterium]
MSSSQESAERGALLELINSGASAQLSDADFNDYALKVFGFQYRHNAPYRAYCDRRERTPATVKDWREVPAVPTAGFKEILLVSGDAADAEVTFRTSGTTRGVEKRGQHLVLDSALYRASLVGGFKHFVMNDAEHMRMLSLMPTFDELPESSLAYMIDTLLHECGSKDSTTAATVRDGINTKHIDEFLRASSEPVCILGTSLAYLHWLEGTASSYQLPAGSRLMDTGGFKGEKRDLTPTELRVLYQERLGIPPSHCWNEYGMTELCSQYYSNDDFVKRAPTWLRFRIVHPETLQAVTPGEHGLIQHYDLGNLYSVSAVLTEDVGYESEDGFVLEGRMAGATPRGCSIAMDILLSDAQRA